MTVLELLGALGAAGVGVALVILGILSRRLGKATQAEPHYLGFFLAAAFCFGSALVQVINEFFLFVTPDVRAASLLWVSLYYGLPAVGVTIGLIFAWHYWSWLLAERSS